MLVSVLHFYSGQPLQNLSGVDTSGIAVVAIRRGFSKICPLRGPRNRQRLTFFHQSAGGAEQILSSSFFLADPFGSPLNDVHGLPDAIAKGQSLRQGRRPPLPLVSELLSEPNITAVPSNSGSPLNRLPSRQILFRLNDCFSIAAHVKPPGYIVSSFYVPESYG